MDYGLKLSDPTIQGLEGTSYADPQWAYLYTNPSYSATSEKEKKDEGYDDAAGWTAAAVKLLSNMERERQLKELLAAQGARDSANYNLNAMSSAGSALERLSQGRRATMGLSSMAGR